KQNKLIHMASTDEIHRQAVCRQGFIGSLYDVRTDKLEGTNLFKKKLPEPFIDVRDNPRTDIELLFHNSQKETFDQMNIEANLKLSLMAGLIDISGSAKYLKQTKTDSRTIRVTYVYKVKTKQEQLHVSMGGLSDYFSADALENPNATHAVTGIMWGANVGATFEQVVENHEKVQTVEGSLSVVLKSLPISGEANLDLQTNNNSKFENLQISFSGDILINECPQSIEDVMRVFRAVPDRLKSLNEGKGQQLVFFLYPLKRIAQIFKHELQITRMIKEVSHLLVMRIENIFEDISKGKRKFNDFLKEIEPWEDYISRVWLNEINNKRAELIASELKTQRELSNLLQKIRGEEAEESEMERLLDNFNRENPCSSMSIEHYLKAKRNVTSKIRTLSDFKREENIFKEIISIEDLLTKYYEQDVYLLHISEKWQTEDKANSLKNLRYFKSLLNREKKSSDEKSNDTTSNSAHIVIDYDLHGPDLEDDDDYCALLTSIFSPTGELTKGDFISEFKKLYEIGNATNYCDYIFGALDEDRSSTISFCEFMNAIALTSKGNTENLKQRLGLMFRVIGRDKDVVNAQQLIKFIEIVTELVHGENAVNPRSIKGIVKRMLEMFKKDTHDGELSKDEFIDCCEKDNEIFRAFLPDAPAIIGLVGFSKL
ncbi:unnamed protein product, partial [Rotaria sordida]